MRDDQLRRLLGSAYARRETAPPAFASVWAAAERRRATQRRVVTGLAAAAIVAALAVGLRVGVPTPSPAYVPPQVLLESTQWRAPSDILLAGEHSVQRIDLYRDLPTLDIPTQWSEGSLL